MDGKKWILGLALSGALFAGGLNAATLGFDDIVADGLVEVPDGYGGLDWSNFFALNATNYNEQDSGYVRGMRSPDYVATNGGGLDAEITGSVLFDVLSFDLTAAWLDDLTVRVTTYTGELLRGDISLNVSQDFRTTFVLNDDFLGIDRIVFEASGGTDAGLNGGGQNFVLDALEVNVVPIPASLWLFGSGLGLLAWVRRRKGARAMT
jgi:hypothetical protein